MKRNGTPRELSVDEISVLMEARAYCVKADKAPSHFNIRSAVRRFYPGRGKKLSNNDIEFYVLEFMSE